MILNHLLYTECNQYDYSRSYISSSFKKDITISFIHSEFRIRWQSSNKSYTDSSHYYKRSVSNIYSKTNIKYFLSIILFGERKEIYYKNLIKDILE
jgi:membrane-bound acyltransferase YfiQ involved in biofilm formation